MDKIKINLSDLLLCMSDAQDLMSPYLAKHHQQVAYLAYQLALRLNLSHEQQQNIILASLVHDIGALSMKERLEIIETEPLGINNHAFIGHKLLSGFQPMERAAQIIKYHHLPWNGGEGRFFGGEVVPVESHLLHLADRVCAMIHSSPAVISILPDILKEMKSLSDIKFVPGFVDVLTELSKEEYIWLDLISQSPVSMIGDDGLNNILLLEIDDIIDLAHIFSQIIDFRSSFTARHSAGVAITAQNLARLVGLSPYECKMMLVAGYLHDLGKIAINNDILEKDSVLDQKEFNEIRMHTYYTFRLLERIPQFSTINKWASFHHEKLDGKGYPFHIKGENLGFGSRLMAVADIFTAIKEDRPYREGMKDENARQVLDNMVLKGLIDKKIVTVLKDNYDEINEKRRLAQEEAAERYNSFLEFQIN